MKLAASQSSSPPISAPKRKNGAGLWRWYIFWSNARFQHQRRRRAPASIKNVFWQSFRGSANKKMLFCRSDSASDKALALIHVWMFTARHGFPFGLSVRIACLHDKLAVNYLIIALRSGRQSMDEIHDTQRRDLLSSRGKPICSGIGTGRHELHQRLSGRASTEKPEFVCFKSFSMQSPSQLSPRLKCRPLVGCLTLLPGAISSTYRQ